MPGYRIDEMEMTGKILWNVTEYTLLRKLIFEGADMERMKDRVANLIVSVNSIIPEYKALWLLRNRQSDLDSSVKNNFDRIIEWAESIL